MLWATYSLLLALLAAYLLSLILRATGDYWTWLDGWVVCAIELDSQRFVHSEGL